jgi:hypothetical protein
VTQGHRGEGLLLPLEDHDCPQFSSANRVRRKMLAYLLTIRSPVQS